MTQPLETNYAARTDPNWPPRDIRQSTSFRRKRFGLFRRVLEEVCRANGTARILDIGGEKQYWDDLRDMWQDLPLEITLINVVPEKRPIDPPFVYARQSALDLSSYPDNSFDIVHSNSVIEHVGRWAAMVRMAQEVRRLAPRYYLQTPNFAFPYEPHYQRLFIHWYPEHVRAQMILKKRRGFMGADTYDQAMLEVQEVRLLTFAEMQRLFPDATIHREKFACLTKSLIAIR